MQVGGQLQRRHAVAGHVLPVLAVRLLASAHPGGAAARAPDFVVAEPVGAGLDAVDALLGAGEDQAVVEALHVAQLGGGVEQRQAAQGVAADGAAPAEFVVVGLHRFEVRGADIEATAGVAQLDADVGQLEALAEGGIDFLASHRRIDDAEVRQHRVVVEVAALDGHRRGGLGLGERDEVVEFGGGVFVAQAAVDRPVFVEAMLQLGERAGAAGA